MDLLNNFMDSESMFVGLNKGQVESVTLKPKDFELAKKISDKVTVKDDNQWEIYLNSLALIGLKKWIAQKNQKLAFDGSKSSLFSPDLKKEIDAVYKIKVEDFIFCIIPVDTFFDEEIIIPREVIYLPEYAAHFYVAIEVLEEQSQVLIRGFLRRDQLTQLVESKSNSQQSQQSQQFKIEQEGYELSLSQFKSDFNQLFRDLDFIEPRLIPMPELPKPIPVKKPIKLRNWFQDVFEPEWEKLENLLSPQRNLAYNWMSDEPIRRAKRIELGGHLHGQAIGLLVSLMSENELIKIDVNLFATGGSKYLPANISLALLTKKGKVIREIKAPNNAYLIKLDSFKYQSGKIFNIRVSLDDLCITESFAT